MKNDGNRALQEVQEVQKGLYSRPMSEEDDHREWSKVGDQKPYAGMLIYAGAGLFVMNIFGGYEPYNNTLATVSAIMALGGVGWLWHLRQEQDRISRVKLDRWKRERDNRLKAERDLQH